MASPSTSSIIIIDDEPDTATGTSTLIKTAEGIESDVYRPSEVNDKILKRSSLILVDYKLDNWPERDRIESVSLKPRDGVALAAVLRSCLKDSLRDTSGEPTPPTAVAVYSARLSELSVGMRPSRNYR